VIEFVRGLLVEKHPTHVVLDCQGVGYRLNIPLSSYVTAGQPGSEAKFLTYHHVREDAEDLYGFSTADERELFVLLLSVSGIGPRLSQSILSGLSASALKSALMNAEVATLTRIPGVGRKTAERMVLELKDKVLRLAADPESALGVASPPGDEAVLALVALGFNRYEAQKAVAQIRRSQDDLAVEDVVRAAIQAVR
jgi:Holliday junction DNA helicase RuvA